jgi:viroplasmin and RNaseH domain-containing protein
MPWYVVFCGLKPGVYFEWSKCNDPVLRFKNASYQKFKTEKEAVLAFQTFTTHGDSRT